MKIVIMGYSGSGKSTLAKMLGEIYGIPVLHLDGTKFYGNWQERDRESQEKIIQEFLDKNENWVIDGNYTKVGVSRFEQSDIAIFLNFNRIFCFFSAYRRYRKHRKTPREDLPCADKFDHQFRKWLLVTGRTKERKIKLMNFFNKSHGEKLIFKNRRQVNKYVKRLREEQNKSNI